MSQTSPKHWNTIQLKEAVKLGIFLSENYVDNCFDVFSQLRSISFSIVHTKFIAQTSKISDIAESNGAINTISQIMVLGCNGLCTSQQFWQIVLNVTSNPELRAHQLVKWFND